MTKAEKYCEETNQVFTFENGQKSYPEEVMKAFDAGRKDADFLEAAIAKYLDESKGQYRLGPGSIGLITAFRSYRKRQE